MRIWNLRKFTITSWTKIDSLFCEIGSEEAEMFSDKEWTKTKVVS